MGRLDLGLISFIPQFVGIGINVGGLIVGNMEIWGIGMTIWGIGFLMFLFDALVN